MEKLVGVVCTSRKEVNPYTEPTRLRVVQALWNLFRIKANFGTFECLDQIQISVYAYVHVCANKGVTHQKIAPKT